MACWKNERWERKFQAKMDGLAERWGTWQRQAPSSGNRAFDEYRADALRRLEEEQREFKDFLDRLRHAKDKAEFDQFMDERRRGGTQSGGSQSGGGYSGRNDGPMPHPTN